MKGGQIKRERSIMMQSMEQKKTCGGRGECSSVCGGYWGVDNTPGVPCISDSVVLHTPSRFHSLPLHCSLFFAIKETHVRDSAESTRSRVTLRDHDDDNVIAIDPSWC